MSVHVHTHTHLSSSLKLTSWFVAIHFSKLTKAFLLIQKESRLFSWNVAFLYTHGRNSFSSQFFVYRTSFTIYNTEPHKNTINQGALNISEVSWKGSHSHLLGGTDGSGDGAGTSQYGSLLALPSDRQKIASVSHFHSCFPNHKCTEGTQIHKADGEQDRLEARAGLTAKKTDKKMNNMVKPSWSPHMAIPNLS